MQLPGIDDALATLGIAGSNRWPQKVSSMVSASRALPRVTPCLDCVYGNHARRPFAQWIEPEQTPLERVYIDLWGPTQDDSIGGHRHYMSVDDGGWSLCQPYFLPDKEADTTLSALRRFK